MHLVNQSCLMMSIGRSIISSIWKLLEYWLGQRSSPKAILLHGNSCATSLLHFIRFDRFNAPCESKSSVSRPLNHLGSTKLLECSEGHRSPKGVILLLQGNSSCATFWLPLASHIIWQVCRVLVPLVNQSCWMMSVHLQLIQRLLECWGHSSSPRILPPDKDLWKGQKVSN